MITGQTIPGHGGATRPLSASCVSSSWMTMPGRGGEQPNVLCASSLDFNASAIDSLDPATKALNASGDGFSTSGVAERVGALTDGQCLEEALWFLGTPDTVIAQIKRLEQQMGGLHEMVIISNVGGVKHWKGIKTQQLFAHYTMPALRNTGGNSA